MPKPSEIPGEREGQDRLLVSGSVLVTEGDGRSRERPRNCRCQGNKRKAGRALQAWRDLVTAPCRNSFHSRTGCPVSLFGPHWSL